MLDGRSHVDYHRRDAGTSMSRFLCYGHIVGFLKAQN